MGLIEPIRLRCVVQAAPWLCWFRFIRMTSGLPSVRAISTNRVHAGWTRRMYPTTSLQPRARAASTTACASSTVVASGFSQKTWQPASSAARANGACVSGYVLMLTTSGRVTRSASW